jgi:glycosyltransferase involved in cell wall biosynthesis
MARESQNPLKETPTPPAPILTLAVVTHYTDNPYHAKRMDVVRMCLDSLLAGAQGLNYEFIIWDNGSTQEFRKILLDYKPTAFVQSVNIGAHDARHALVNMARGNLICMTDDDILFHPDWFHLQLEILTTYPRVALVSGSPQRTGFRAATSANIRWTNDNPETVKTTVGKIIPEQFERDFAMSIGRDWKRHQEVAENFDDTLLEYNGVKAWAHGHHMQFLAYRNVIAPYLVRSPLMLDNHKLFNTGPDDDGMLNLTTYRRTALHIGNIIDDNIMGIAAGMRGERVAA